MRLTQEQQRTIRDEAITVFGPSAHVRLFGSRVDDTARGGDIDIHIQSDLNNPAERLDRELIFRARLSRRLGDRRIDVVVQSRAEAPRRIDRAALDTGIQL